jgi:hypothetical protein
MKIDRTTEACHPVLADCIKRINTDVIQAHNTPMRLFEAGRTHDRHNMLIQRGKTKDIVSRHLYNLDNDPPLFATAVDYVYYDKKWSWNLRDNTVQSWFILFGNLVLDVCPELEWGGQNRKSTNYCHFQLRRAILIENLDKIPCVAP